MSGLLRFKRRPTQSDQPEVEIISFIDRLRTPQAIFFVSLAVVANVIWVVFVGWVLYRLALFFVG